MNYLPRSGSFRGHSAWANKQIQPFPMQRAMMRPFHTTVNATPYPTPMQPQAPRKGG